MKLINTRTKSLKVKSCFVFVCFSWVSVSRQLFSAILMTLIELTNRFSENENVEITVIHTTLPLGFFLPILVTFTFN